MDAIKQRQGSEGTERELAALFYTYTYLYLVCQSELLRDTFALAEMGVSSQNLQYQSTTFDHFSVSARTLNHIP